jgi:hypothetical protein
VPTSDRQSRIVRLAGNSSVHVGSAIIVMGSWAAFANRSHGAAPAIRAMLTQAAASGLVTFSLKTFLEAISRRLRGTLAFIVPPTLSCLVVLAFLIAAHRLSGTRELVATIAVPYAASSTYAWIYSALLVWRRSQAADGR